MASEDDIVQNVRIEADDNASKAIKSAADEAVAAMQRANAEADKMAKANEEAAKSVLANAAAAKKLAEDIDKIGAPQRGVIAGNTNLNRSLGQVTSGFGSAAKAFGNFAKRALATGTAVAGAATGIVVSLRNLSKAYTGVEDPAKKSADAQIEAMRSGQESAAAARAYGRSINDLNRELASGKINYEQYSESMASLKREYRESRQEAVQLSIDQKNLADQTERLQRAAASNKVFSDLADKVGGPLATSLLNAGKAADSFYNTVVSKLSGPLANIVNRVVQLFEKNSTQIGAFFDKAASALNSFADSGGVEKTFNNIVGIAQQVGTVITSVVVPAFQAMYAVLQTVASAINSVFGTNFTAGGLAAIVVIAGLTKSFALLGGIITGLMGVFGLLRVGLAFLGPAMTAIGVALRVALLALGPFGIAIAAIGTAIYLVATRTKFFQTIWASLSSAGTGSANALRSAWEGIGSFFSGLWQGIQSIGSTVWGAITSAASSAASGLQSLWSGIVSFFSGIWTGITSGAASVWSSITSAASSAVEGVQTAWNGVVQFFSGLGASIGFAFTTVWATLQAGWAALVEGIKSAWTGLTAFFATLGTTISTAFSATWQALTSGWSIVVEGIKSAFNGVVEFFSQWGGSVTGFFTGIIEQIKQAFSSGVDGIKQFFQGLYQSIMSVINPIINAIQKIIDLGKRAASAIGLAKGGEVPAFASGGAVRGPGTGTSDSILARLSNGEFVMRAKAVRNLGLRLLHALNSGRFDPSNFLPGFAEGGLVGAGAGLIRFPSTGGNSGRRERGGDTVYLTIDGHQFGGMTAPRSVARELKDHAVKSKTRATGRQPSWV